MSVMSVGTKRRWTCHDLLEQIAKRRQISNELLRLCADSMPYRIQLSPYHDVESTEDGMLYREVICFDL